MAGLKGYVTNIPATVMDTGEVIGAYHDLWHVEQSFRMSKTDLQARPLFARTRDAIEAHLTIVFTALAVSRTVQDRTGRSIRRVLRELRPLRSATIEINGATQTYPTTINDDHKALSTPSGHRPPGTKAFDPTQVAEQRFRGGTRLRLAHGSDHRSGRCPSSGERESRGREVCGADARCT